jgi:hypothetical protein
LEQESSNAIYTMLAKTKWLAATIVEMNKALQLVISMCVINVADKFHSSLFANVEFTNELWKIKNGNR